MIYKRGKDNFCLYYALSEIGISIDANFDESEEKSLEKLSDVT